MANSIVQTIKEAEIDARSLSEFIYNPADAMVTRRLASSIHSLQYYLDYLNAVPSIVNDAINNTAIEGGVLADTFVTATANGMGGVARTQRDKNADYVSVKDFGAKGDNLETTVQKWIDDGRYSSLQGIQADYPHVTTLTDSLDWAAIQQAINKHDLVHMPSGKYFINKTLQLRSNVFLRGAGIGATTILSRVDNAPAVKLSAQHIFGGIFDIAFKAKNSSTSGHCISTMGLEEGESESSSHSPQHFRYENLRITGYKGESDDSIESGQADKKMPACGIAQRGGISTKIVNCTVENCGFGVSLSRSGTTLMLGCVIVNNKYAGVYAHRNTSLVVSRGNIINNGSLEGIAEAGLSTASLFNYNASGNIVCIDENYPVVENTRFKNDADKPAKADMCLISCAGALVQGNTFRGAYNSDLDAYVSLYCEGSRGLSINSNRFGAATPDNKYPTATYKNVVFKQTSLNSVLSSSITNNLFDNLQLKKVSFYIGFLGYVSKRGGVINTRIEGNVFGDRDWASAVEVDTCILVKDTQFYNSKITYNHCHPSRSFTLGSVVKFENVDVKKSRIDKNLLIKSSVDEVNVGFSGVVYDGIVPDNQYFNHKVLSATTVAASGSTDIVIPLTGLLSGAVYDVKAVFTAPLKGLVKTAWLSGSNELTVRLINNGSPEITIPKTDINITVSRVDDISKGALS